MMLSLLQRDRTEAREPRETRQRKLGLDFHNHLLPGVDDGMADEAEAIAGITALAAAGFTGAVVTPHIYPGLYDNEPAALRAAFAGFLPKLASAGLNFPLYLAAEYFADEQFLARVQTGDLLHLPVGGERWVLVEFSCHHEDQLGAVCVAALAARGYRPVIAHVERYHYVARGRAVWLSRLARAGALLQVDIGSLAGQHGETAKHFAAWLLARGMVSLLGSDLHKPDQMARFISPGLKLLQSGQRLNALLDGVAAA